MLAVLAMFQVITQTLETVSNFVEPADGGSDSQHAHASGEVTTEILSAPPNMDDEV